ncbi:hypothetical protein VI08_09325 [Luteibacter yeojuensis]|uniref:Uncharacterized protein n=1 Tax=Luteibacter yeojuensis TaxID=345309 RepID=A0A0F3KU84_9GAMM|nr:hypothetical protein VI08_09325 [Luteibacter yeojuensis]
MLLVSTSQSFLLATLQAGYTHLRAWAADVSNWGAVRSDLLAEALGALERRRVIIPFLQLDVRLRALESGPESLHQQGASGP